MVSLNVGGVIYLTSKTTLLKHPGTMLHSMFSGRHTVTKDQNGHYFIDRDGTIFKYILNYLRTGYFPDLPVKELIELKIEAEYFSITPLVLALDRQLESLLVGKFAVLRYNENSNVNNLSWQGMTEPCTLKVGKNLYKCIDDVLTEVDNRGWELTQMGGDGNAEGGWKYVFRKKPSFMGGAWRQHSNSERFIISQSTQLGKTINRKHSGSF
uniref:BTB domain-containing protein n=1 Tax=Arcella intermedia TaxID=1963864 RepID=A0A6B2LI17_9EUKA